MGKTKSEKKRTKSQSSPDSVSDRPEKRTNMSDVNTQDTQSTPPPAQNPQSSPYLPPYMGQYLPPHTQFLTPQPTSLQQGSPTSIHTYHTQLSNRDIMDKLESIDRRLSKLDTIETQMASMTQKITIVDQRVSSLESKLTDSNRKLSDVEASRAFDSQICEEIKRNQSEIEKLLRSEKENNSDLLRECKQMRAENSKLSEEVIDLQARSMRDNLLFFNFDECDSFDGRKQEDCCAKLLDFCANKLEMPDARTTIKIDRAHRIGKFISGKKRPIVAKFNFYRDKLDVKHKVHEKRGSLTVRVSDQYPKEIQDRRKQLIPEMIKARESRREAVLKYDKLYIDGRLFRPEADVTPVRD